MKFLILGGAGFIGTNLAKALIRIGHDVIVFDIPNADYTRFKDVINRVSLLKGFFHEIDKINNIFLNDKPDAVIHLISAITPDSTVDGVINEINESIVNTLRLLFSMHEFGCNHLIYFSSGGTIYGKNGKKVNTENDETCPINSYGWIKLCIEKLIQQYAHSFNYNYMILRPSNPYGPYQNIYGKQGLVAVTIGKMINNEQMDVWGNGEIIRDYIYIEDLCNIVLLLIKHNAWNDIYNIGTNQGLSINNILLLVRQVLNKNLNVKYMPERGIDINTNILDNRKLLSIIGNYEFTEIKAGILNTWKWVNKIY